MDENLTSIWLGICGAVLSTGFLLLALFDRRQAQIDLRLQQLPESPFKPLPPDRRSPTEPAKANVLSSGAPAQRVSDPPVSLATQETSWWSKLAPVGMVFSLLLGMLLARQGFVEQRTGLMLGSLLGLALFTCPRAWIRHRILKQQAELRHALPDFLDLMIVCLEGGLSVQGALQRVAAEIRIAHPRLGGELEMVQRDVELGTTIDAAFRNFANRSGLDAVRTLSSFIREAQRFGSQLGDALRSHAEMLRYQREQAAEEQAQKASVKMLFPTLLLILPAVFVVLVGPAAIKIQEAFSK